MATSCPSSAETKPIYLLTLVPFPDPLEGGGWDKGLGAISGARVARDAINNRTDLLPGYHIELIVQNVEACSRTEASIGLNNLVKYTVGQLCRPVVAVAGLLCSSHTAILSPLAGHTGLSLIQLSVANAPFFQTQSKRYPHLWRFLGAGKVFSDATIALMERLGWNRTGIVYDSDNSYFTNIVALFQQQLLSLGRNVVFSTGITENVRRSLFRQIKDNIQEKAVTVLFVAIDEQLSAELLCWLYEEDLLYPYYTWIQVGKTLDEILLENTTCSTETLRRAKRGHIQMKIQIGPSNISNILVSGKNYSDYLQDYKKDLKQVENIYNLSLAVDKLYSSIMHDQVWAIALAINNSFQELERRNLSIDSYTFGELEITNVIEEQLSRVNFAGASGEIIFNDQHGVIPTVQVFMISNESKELLVGLYQHGKGSENNTYNLTLTIDSNDVPDDAAPIMYIHIHKVTAVFLYITACLTILFSTIVLALLIYFREWSEVKATSPHLSVIIIMGCYLLCIAAIFRTTYAWNQQVIQSNRIHTILVTVDFVCITSGLSVVIITMFFKLLRVFHIFFNMTMKARILWRTSTLFLLILVLSSWNTLLVLFALVFSPPRLGFVNRHKLDPSRNLIVKEMEPYSIFSTVNLAALITTAIYLLMFLMLIVYLAIRMRKIKRNDFKDTKKINLFVAILTVTIVMTALIIVPLTLSNNHYIANIVMVVALLIIPNIVSVILFLPKIIPAMLKPRPKRRTLRRATTYTSSHSQLTSTILLHNNMTY